MFEYAAIFTSKGFKNYILLLIKHLQYLRQTKSYNQLAITQIQLPPLVRVEWRMGFWVQDPQGACIIKIKIYIYPHKCHHIVQWKMWLTKRLHEFSQ